jgi:hypothetical protein
LAAHLVYRRIRRVRGSREEVGGWADV